MMSGWFIAKFKMFDIIILYDSHHYFDTTQENIIEGKIENAIH